jgi:hypothetical protein
MDNVPLLDATQQGVKEIFEILERGDQQAETRDAVIATINDLCDGLQAGADLVSKELSSAILEYHALPADVPRSLVGFFERTAARVANPHLRLLLHEGKVCGRLHALGDRFSQPFSPESRSAVSAWQAVCTLFTRSNPMSIAINGITEGEQHYLYEFGEFLNEIRDAAEAGAALVWQDEAAARKEGARLVDRMREKRTALQRQILELRGAADEAIAKLA